MKAIGNFLIIKEIEENIKKTSGGLELTQSHREEVRYIKGLVVSAGPDIVNEGDTVMFDRVAGYTIEEGDKQYKVIQGRDVVAIM